MENRTLLNLNLIYMILNGKNISKIYIKKMYSWLNEIDFSNMDEEIKKKSFNKCLSIYYYLIKLEKNNKKIPVAISNDLKLKIVDIIFKLGYKEELEKIWLYKIIKIILFDEKNYELFKTILYELPEVIKLINDNILDNGSLFNDIVAQYLDLILIGSKEYQDYEKIIVMLLENKLINISKDNKKKLCSKISRTMELLKRSKLGKRTININNKSLENIASILTKSKSNLLPNALVSKYDITTGYSNINEKYVCLKSAASDIDLTNKLTYSIDSFLISSIDDAFSIEKNDKGNYILEVYISDVTSYVNLFSSIDKDAYKKGYTIYLPNNNILMLPPNLSHDYLSLKSNQNKRVLVHRFEFSDSLDLIDFSVYNGIINVNKNLTYSDIDNILETSTDLNELNFFKLLLEFYGKFSKLKFYDMSYRKVKKVKRLIKSDEQSIEESDNSIACEIISSFMIFTNYYVAREFEKRQFPFIYTVNKSLRDDEIVNRITVEMKKSQEIKKFLESINEKYYSSYYSIKNEGHGGLGLDSYCHATNPIRNYASLTVQRLEHDFLLNNNIQDDSISFWEDYLNVLIPYLNYRKGLNKSYQDDYYKVLKMKRKTP